MITDNTAGVCGRSSFKRYLFGALIALELLMSFTFMGYIHMPPISITIAYIPVILAACLLGVGQSVFIGMLFGLGSLYKASAAYVLAGDKIFSPFQSDEPLGSILLSVGSRMAFALVIGLLFSAAAKATHVRSRGYTGFHAGMAATELKYVPREQRNGSAVSAGNSNGDADAHNEPVKNKGLFCALTALIALLSPKIHSFMVFSVMGIFFPEFGYDHMSSFSIDFNDIMLALLCVIVTETAWLIYDSAPVRDFAFCVDMANESPYIKKMMNWFFLAFEILIVILSIFATTYFSQRTSYLLSQYNIHVSSDMQSDILLLHIQFLIAMLGLSLISLLLVICIYRYMSYREYRGDLDALTGVMGRRMFMYHCERIQSGNDAVESDEGWFLFVDVDYFKSINDTFGHATGDMVLREIASRLQRIFGSNGAVGRVGGDEFAVMIEKPVGQADIETLLDGFLSDIADIIDERTGDAANAPHRNVSCSIGAYRFTYPQTMKHLMSETDEMLYKAKAIGRACYVVEAGGEITAGGPRLTGYVDC